MKARRRQLRRVAVDVRRRLELALMTKLVRPLGTKMWTSRLRSLRTFDCAFATRELRTLDVRTTVRTGEWNGQDCEIHATDAVHFVLDGSFEV